MIVIILLVLLVLGIVIGASFLGSWLWNITMPYIFGLPTVEWWHILALMILLWILIPTCIIKKDE